MSLRRRSEGAEKWACFSGGVGGWRRWGEAEEEEVSEKEKRKKTGGGGERLFFLRAIEESTVWSIASPKKHRQSFFLALQVQESREQIEGDRVPRMGTESGEATARRGPGSRERERGRAISEKRQESLSRLDLSLSLSLEGVEERALSLPALALILILPRTESAFETPLSMKR